MFIPNPLSKCGGMRKNTPKVTVITVLYNFEHIVELALETVSADLICKYFKKVSEYLRYVNNKSHIFVI